MMRSLFSQGGKLKGPEFIVHVQQFSATNTEFDTQAEITATEKVDLLTGTSNTSSHTQTVYKGVIWNKVSSESQKHLTHQACSFRQPVTFHTPDLTMERVRGSGVIENLHSDTPVQYRDMLDVHEHHQHSQKSLSAGAALITKLAVGLILYSNPVTFGLGGTPGVMVNAGFGALCSDATVCLVENDGDPGKAIQALSKSKIAMNVARSMLTAGLVGEISDVVGLPSTNLELIDYAQKATIQSAVNTVLAVSIDGQNFEKALMQGMTTAALSTATSYLANQIGQSYFDTQLNWLEHKTLHALLGGLSGGVSSKLFGGSFERGAISGALGAVVAEAVAEMLKPDLTSEMLSSQNKNLSKDEFEKEFMEKAQQSSKWADFVGSVSAFGMGLDTNIAYQTSSNATQNNFLPGILLALTVGSTVYEGYQIHQTYKNEGGEAALKHLGITVVSAAVVGGIATVGFKVGKAVYPSLHEAYKAAVASRPMLASALTAMESRLGKIEKYVKDQFDYKRHFVNKDKGINWLDEKAVMSDKARMYNDSVSGARSNAISGNSQAPSLKYSNKDGIEKTVRFDGIEDKILIDRKLAVVTTEKARNQALRQSEALEQNGLLGRWEVPTESELNRALKMFEELNVKNIGVKVVKIPKF
jgi:filamentous hemagglutinin